MRFTPPHLGVLAGVLALGALVIACPSSNPTAPRDAGLLDAGTRPDAADAAAAMLRERALAQAADEVVLPPSASEELTARARHLLEAVAHDNADLAADILFPRDGFITARDSADPGKAWDAKIAPAFRR